MGQQRDLDSQFEQDNFLTFDIAYETWFVDLQEIIRVKDKLLQFKGHDVYLIFPNEKIIIDEKVRRADWDDILIEYLHDKERQIPGWIYKNESNYYLL